MYMTKTSPNGQVVIPAELRRAKGIKPATQFLILERGDDLLLKRVADHIIALFNCSNTFITYAL